MSVLTDEQRTCTHDDIAWAPDGLDGMCKKCRLYLMTPNCAEETQRWYREHFGNTDPADALRRILE